MQYVVDTGTVPLLESPPSDRPDRRRVGVVFENGDTKVSAAMVAILPGQQEFHRTEHPEEEICYVTAGYGQIVIGEDIFDIKKGSAIFIPSMANHRLINLGDENLEMICILNTLKGGFFDGGFDKLFTDSGWTKVG